MYLRIRGQGGTLFPKDRCIIAGDGTHIAYTLRGRGRITVALCAGFCCSDNFWRYLSPALERRYRVLIWNYRGAGVSGLPREPGYRARRLTVEDFTMARHAQDLAAILEHEGIEDAVVLGHSMGVQVALESYRLMPDRVRAIVAVTGPFSSPMETFYNTALARRAFPAASALLKAFPQPFRTAWREIFRSGLPHPLAIRFKAISERAASEDMRPYYDHLAELDPLIMMKIAEAMHRHSAEDLLPRIAVPTLVIVGERDNFSPPALGRVMVSHIPVAELMVVPGGTHAALLEDPKRVNRVITEFLERRLGAAARTAEVRRL